MADNSLISWCDATLNYVSGCTVVSPGCTNCYAMKLAGTRLRNHPTREGLTDQTKAGPVWNGTVRQNEDHLMQALRWKRPRAIFWNAHGDLFHPAVPREWIDRQFAVMAATPQHRHMILTKRSARAKKYLSDREVRANILDAASHLFEDWKILARITWGMETWPLPNVWLGVSVEDQKRADKRVPDLLATPAAVRFLSCEPLLGPVDLFEIPKSKYVRLNALTGFDWDELGERGTGGPHIDWVICGGESGPGARPMHPAWARKLRDQCAAANVAFHFKQWGSSCPLRNELIPVPRKDIGWVAQDGRYKFDASEDDFGAMYLDDNKHGCNWWSQTVRVGKKAAGRLLDGVEHNGVPA